MEDDFEDFGGDGSFGSYAPMAEPMAQPQPQQPMPLALPPARAQASQQQQYAQPRPVPVAPYMPVSSPYLPAYGAQMGGIEELPPASSSMLGIALLAVVGGAALGAKFGGAYGALAGSLLAGAGVNAFRAVRAVQQGTPEGDKEAQISGAFAVGGAALGGFLWYKLVGVNEAIPNEGSDEEGQAPLAQPKRLATSNTTFGGACNIRPVGP